MNRIILILFACTVVISAHVQSNHVLAADKPQDSLPMILKKEKDKLDLLRDKIEKQGQKVSQADEKETSFLQNLSQIEDRLRFKEKELDVYKGDIQFNKNKTAALSAEIQELEKVREKQQSVLAKRLRMTHKEGNLLPIKVLFSADNVNDLMQRVKYLEMVTSYDSSIFQKYQEKLHELKVEKENLLQTHAKLLVLEQEALNKKEEIHFEKEEKANLVNKLKNEKTLALQARQELIKASGTLNNLILGLEKKLESGEGLNFEESKGLLNAPAKGEILNHIGKKRDRDFETYIVYNGINIKTPKGTPVRAVYEGKVLFAGSLAGYGNLIILGHGEKYHTLYGHLDEIITAVGKKVRVGQIIAKSGDSGSLVGETLYFELRQMGKPIEPTGWFRVAKK